MIKLGSRVYFMTQKYMAQVCMIIIFNDTHVLFFFFVKISLSITMNLLEKFYALYLSQMHDYFTDMSAKYQII